MIVKGIPIDGIYIVKLEGKKHIFIATKGGSIIHVDVEKRITRTINCSFSDNEYPSISYSHTAKKVYFYVGGDVQMVQYDYNSGIVKHFNLQKYFDLYSNHLSNVPMYMNGKQVNQAGTDGNLYFGTTRYRGIPSILKFNTITEQVDGYGIADKEFEHIHGKQYCQAYQFDGPLSGVYSAYVYDDSYNDLVDEIKADAISNGVTFSFNQMFYLHYADRSVSSPTRRVFAVVNGTWKVIDLKNPGVYYNSGTSADVGTALTASWVDQSGTTVLKSGWTNGLLGTYAATLGFTNPSFDPSIAYNGAYSVGRFAYNSNYMAGKTIFYHFAYHPITLEALYPDTFDKSTTFQSNGSYATYTKLCNFRGDYGFSTNDEYVLFVPNNANVLGFFRPDTNTWTAYNPNTDPNGYVIRSVTISTEFNWDVDYYSSGSDLTINDEVFKSRLNVAVRVVGQSLDKDRNVGKLTIEIIPNISNPADTFTVTSKYGPAVSAAIVTSVPLTGGKLLFAGARYAGIAGYQYDGTDLLNKSYLADISSLYFGLKITANKAYFGGYLATQHFVETTDINNPVQTNVNTGSYSKDGRRGTVHNNHIIQVGSEVRQAAYFNGYFYAALINHATYSVSDIPNKPNQFNPQVGRLLRQALGLTQNTYSDSAVELAFQNWITANGYTRSQGINLFLDTAKWSSNDIVNFGNTSVFSLTYPGISALRGIRINQFADGSGVWFDENYGRSTKYPACLVITKPDMTTISQTDYKLVEFQISGLQGKDTVGRVGVSDNYVFFPNNYISEGKYKIHVISKTALLAAATAGTPITAWDRVIEVAIGSTTVTTLGISGGQYFGTRYEYQDVYFIIGEDLYISVNLHNSDVVIQKINLSTGTVTDICSHSNNLDKVISYDSETNRMWVCIGTEAYHVDNLTTISTLTPIV